MKRNDDTKGTFKLASLRRSHVKEGKFWCKSGVCTNTFVPYFISRIVLLWALAQQSRAWFCCANTAQNTLSRHNIQLNGRYYYWPLAKSHSYLYVVPVTNLWLQYYHRANRSQAHLDGAVVGVVGYEVYLSALRRISDWCGCSRGRTLQATQWQFHRCPITPQAM